MAVVLCSTASRSFAQQSPQFSQYFFNQYTYNPAYGGLDKALSLTVHGRAQWVGIEGYPFSQNVSVHSPMSILHGGGGLQVINEQAGALRLTSASLSYSYIIKTRAGFFSIGVSGGVIQAAIDGGKLLAPDGDYVNTINHNDPILSSGSVSGLGPDAAAGIFFSGSAFTLGLSATHLFPVQIAVEGTSSNIGFDLQREYYLQSSFRAPLSRAVVMRPVIMLKANGSNFQGEGDLLFGYKNFIWAGIGYRGFDAYTQDAAVGIAALSINENLLLSYSYDFPVSALEKVSQGSHEVMINYRVNLFKPALPGKAIFNPRF
jgi:type IX secretion system PorP/SprF family membrane protein